MGGFQSIDLSDYRVFTPSVMGELKFLANISINIRFNTANSLLKTALYYA